MPCNERMPRFDTSKEIIRAISSESSRLSPFVSTWLATTDRKAESGKFSSSSSQTKRGCDARNPKRTVDSPEERVRPKAYAYETSRLSKYSVPASTRPPCQPDARPGSNPGKDDSSKPLSSAMATSRPLSSASSSCRLAFFDKSRLVSSLPEQSKLSSPVKYSMPCNERMPKFDTSKEAIRAISSESRRLSPFVSTWLATNNRKAESEKFSSSSSQTKRGCDARNPKRTVDSPEERVRPKAYAYETSRLSKYSVPASTRPPCQPDARPGSNPGKDDSSKPLSSAMATSRPLSSASSSCRLAFFDKSRLVSSLPEQSRLSSPVKYSMPCNERMPKFDTSRCFTDSTSFAFKIPFLDKSICSET